MKTRYVAKAVAFALLCFAGQDGYGQIYPSTDENGKFGYVNEKGDTVVAFNLDEAYHLKNGAAKFRKDGKCGFIDAEGNIIVEPKYVETGTFNPMGVCWVCMKGGMDKNGLFNGSLFGLINLEGKEIIPPFYKEIGSFSVMIKGDKYLMYDEKEMTPDVMWPPVDVTADNAREKTNWMHIVSSELPMSPHPYFWYTNDTEERQVGVVDIDGIPVFGTEMYYTVFPPSEGMILLRYKTGRNLKVAYFNMEAKQAYKAELAAKFYPFKCGLAKAELGDEKGYCFIDKQMNVVTPVFKGAGNFNEGVCPVVDAASGLCGLIDSTGASVTPYVYKTMGSQVYDGLIYVCDANGKYGYINAEGNIAIPMEYENAVNFSHGLAGVKQGGKWGYVNRMNEVVVPLAWDDLILVQYDNQPLIWVQELKKWGGYSLAQKRVVTLNGYDQILSYKSRDFFLVKNGEKYGIINNEGVEAIPVAINTFEDADATIRYLEANDKQQITGIELRHYLLQLPGTSANGYNLAEKIPEESWDY